MIEINRILCPVDFSPFSERALAYAMKLSVWFGAKLQVLHVMPLLPPSTVNALAATDRDLSARNLQTLVKRQRLPQAEVESVLVESGDTAEKILRVADDFDADVIVTGSHGRAGLERVVLGSVVEALLHRCGRPILTVPSHFSRTFEGEGATFARMVCAVDFSEASLNAVAFAVALAEESAARLTLLHVIEMQPEWKRADAEASALTRLRALIPNNATEYCDIDTAVLEGGVSRQLLRMADERRADLMVLGVHGRNAFDLAFFGSNSKDVVRYAHCPVLIVPASRRRAGMRVAS
jgi:nucleotide-binding universal stress UspA family protein